MLKEDTCLKKKDKKINDTFKKNQKEKIIKKFYRREKMLVKSNNIKNDMLGNKSKNKNKNNKTAHNTKSKKMKIKQNATKKISQEKTHLTIEERILYDSIKIQKKRREQKKKIFAAATDLVHNKQKELNVGRKVEANELPEWVQTIKLIERYKKYLLIKKRKKKRQIYTDIIFEENLTKMVLPSSVRVSSENEAKTMVKFINKISKDMKNCNLKTKTQKQKQKNIEKNRK